MSKEIPEYRWVQKPDPKSGATNGCYGCAFRKMLEVRCSLIPCQKHPNHVAELMKGSK